MGEYGWDCVIKSAILNILSLRAYFADTWINKTAILILKSRIQERGMG